MGKFKDMLIEEQDNQPKDCKSKRKVKTGRMDAVIEVDGEEIPGTEWVCLDCGCIWVE